MRRRKQGRVRRAVRWLAELAIDCLTFKFLDD